MPAPGNRSHYSIKMRRYYVFDVDNTLVFTDALNTEAYNAALMAHGLDPIKTGERITRETVVRQYPDLSAEQLKLIIQEKQAYCKAHAEETEINSTLLEFLKKKTPESCLFWTSADQERIQSLLDYYSISNLARERIVADKKHIPECIAGLQRIFRCSADELLVFEDNPRIIRELRENGISVIDINAETNETEYA